MAHLLVSYLGSASAGHPSYRVERVQRRASKYALPMSFRDSPYE